MTQATPSHARHFWRARQTPWLLVIGALLTCVAPLLSGQQTAGYRDAVQFYYPLYHWIAECWGRGQLPLWNPLVDAGVPVVAEATSAVFYPGKLIFALPVGYALRYNIYLVSHLLLAAAATYYVARRWRLRRAAAALAAVSYALSGNVLFQYCNVVFLVGAAWLPVSLLAVDRMVEQRSWRASLGLGGVLALMTLGGDPEMAYHAGLIAVLYVGIAWRARSRGHARNACSRHRGSANLRPHVVRLVLAAGTAALLAAVQWVPAAEWTRVSRRASYQVPRNIYEAIAYHHQQAKANVALKSVIRYPIAAGLFGPPVPGTHHRQVYDFSVSPVRAVEWVWPNFSGRSFPENHRWLSAAGLEDRVWCPSFYMGLLPLLLAFRQMRRRNKRPRETWLMGIVLLSGVASLGWYGPGWLANVIGTSMTGRADFTAVGAPTGGLYWLMATVLPGYVYFRYPAKLLVCATMGMSLLAAVEFDRMRFAVERTPLLRALAIIGTASLVMLVAVFAAQPWLSSWFAAARADELYGPLDISGAWHDALTGCLHAAVVAGLAWAVFCTKRFGPNSCRVLLLMLTCCELVVANHWMVMTVRSNLLTMPTVLSRIAANKPSSDQTHGNPTSGNRMAPADVGSMQDPAVARATTYRWIRFYRRPDRRWVPRDWPRERTLDRPGQTVRWDRETMLPNLHLVSDHPEAAVRWAAVAARTTIVPDDYARWLRHASGHDPQPLALDLLGVRYVLVPDDVRWPQRAGMQLVPITPVKNLRLWQNPNAFPHAWIVHTAVDRQSLARHGPAAVRAAIEDAAHDGTKLSLRTAVLIDAHSTSPQIIVVPKKRASTERCHLVVQSNGRLTLDARLDTPGWVVVNDLFYPGWHASAVSENGRHLAIRILRANGIMRAVFLPAGRWRVEFTYRPTRWYAVAVVSALAWLLLLGVSSVWWYRTGTDAQTGLFHCHRGICVHTAGQPDT